MDIYDRIIAAWPHLTTLATRARAGSVSAHNTLATNVLQASVRDPLTAKDIWDIAKWRHHPYRRDRAQRERPESPTYIGWDERERGED